ncbi:lipase maturation factor 2-like [Daktulosphaira vitifoliae]|uniref:lipase maturation factor 2-like n=1 Tax=Daktulosphaira vitifoliae TaxID=58002 RepID=UPI0021AA2CFF|nr:lipase maturation factor 2-like [Daktulosphaira vitifoliae]
MQYIRYTRNLFLRGIAVVNLLAFISLYIQKPGLYGDNGIFPVKNALTNESPKLLDKFNSKPTLLWFSSEIGLNTDYMFDLITLVGIIFSFLGFVSQKACNKFVFFILWISYLSLYNVGQIFMSHLVDEILLEVGLLSILVAPFFHPSRKPVSKKRNLRSQTSLASSPYDAISFWLVRWLLFRVSYSAGITKMSSKSLVWYDLTAMSKFFEIMPLPSYISCYVYNFPLWVLKSLTVLAEVNEIFLPLLFLIPIGSVKKLAFYIQMTVQFLIFATGNFGYYNLLYIVLCLSLLDDHTFYKELALTKSRQWCSSIFTRLMTLNAVVLLVAIIAMLYNFRITPGNTPDFKIAFTPNQFNSVLQKSLPIIGYFALASFGLECLKSIYASLPTKSKTGGSLSALISATFYVAICLGLFSLSSVNFSALHPSVNNTIPRDLKLFYNKLSPYKLSNSYIPPKELLNFESRKEIVLEGASDLKGPWYEYQFVYKPSSVNVTPPIIAPYRPMIDEEFFYAAYTPSVQNPWLFSVIYRLLNNQKEVCNLINPNQINFVKSPPKFIKASLYNYKYASNVQRNRGVWWTRQLVSDYIAPLDKNSQVLLDTLKSHKILLNRTSKAVNPLWKQILDQLRLLQLAIADPRILISAFLIAGLIIIIIPGGGSA